MSRFLKELFERGYIEYSEAMKKYGKAVTDRSEEMGWARFDRERNAFFLTKNGEEFVKNRIFAPQEIANIVAERIREVYGDVVDVAVEINWKEEKKGRAIPLGKLKVIFSDAEKARKFAIVLPEYRKMLPPGFNIEVHHNAYEKIDDYWLFHAVDSGFFEITGLVLRADMEPVQTEIGRVRRVTVFELNSVSNGNREPWILTCLFNEETDRVQVGEVAVIRGRKEPVIALATGGRPLRGVLVAEEVKRVDSVSDWIEANKEIYEKYRENLLNLIYEDGVKSPDNIRWIERDVEILDTTETYRVPAIMDRIANLINYGVAYPRPLLYVLSLLAVPKSGLSVMLIGDKGTGKNTAARVVGRLLEIGGKKYHVYRCERATVANVFGGVSDSGTRTLLKGSVLLYDFVVFDEFHGAQTSLKSKMREYMGEHKVTVDLMSSNKPAMPLEYPAWQPCLILSNDKNGEDVEKIRFAGDKPVPVPLQEVLHRLVSGPFIDRLSFYALITDGDAHFWKDEISKRQERYKIIYKNNEKVLDIKYPNEKSLEAFMKTLFYEMDRVHPKVPDDIEKYLSEKAERRERDALKLASLAIAKLCLSNEVTKEMVDLAVFLRRWCEKTLTRQYYFYVDLNGNILEMPDDVRREIEERYMSKTVQIRDARLREIEVIYKSWIEQNAKLPSKSELARMLGLSMSSIENLLNMLYPDVMGVRVKRGVKYVLIRPEIFERFSHLFDEVDFKDLERIRKAYIRIYGEEPRFGPFTQSELFVSYVRVTCGNCGHEWEVPNDVVLETVRCPVCGERGPAVKGGGGNEKAP